jgi:hypothetical protein
MILENCIDTSCGLSQNPNNLDARIKLLFSNEEDIYIGTRVIQCLSEAYLERLKQSDMEA